MIKMSMQSYDERLKSIYMLNLSYLLLAQRLIKHDRFMAGFCLGMTDDLVDIITDLALPQLIRLASVDQLICQLRIDNESVLNAITKTSRLEALQGMHTSIILSTSLMHDLQEREETSPAQGQENTSDIPAEEVCPA